MCKITIEIQLQVVYSCIKNISYIKRRRIMQEITDLEFIAMLHQLPDKAAYVSYLKALAASPTPQPVSPVEAGA